MLLTMRHEANRRGFIMPTPERLWKVSEHRVSGTVKAKPEGGGGRIALPMESKVLNFHPFQEVTGLFEGPRADFGMFHSFAHCASVHLLTKLASLPPYKPESFPC